jgi:hypothetical protein
MIWNYKQRNNTISDVLKFVAAPLTVNIFTLCFKLSYFTQEKQKTKQNQKEQLCNNLFILTPYIGLRIKASPI